MIELPPSTFTFGNYGFHIPLGVYLDRTKLMDFVLSQNIIGYQKYPSFKTKEDCFAVMFEDEDDYNERWCHIPYYIMNELLGIQEEDQ